jgi:hypothetical protein
VPTIAAAGAGATVDFIPTLGDWGDDDGESNAAQLARALQWELGLELEPELQTGLRTEESAGMQLHDSRSSPERLGHGRLYEVDHGEGEMQTMMERSLLAWL